MVKYSICIGLNDKDSHVQEVPTAEAYKIVSEILRDTVGGATITEGVGVYTHDDGTPVIEKSLICTVLDFGGFTANDLNQALSKIIDIFNQESVLFETTETNAVFFRGN